MLKNHLEGQANFSIRLPIYLLLCSKLNDPSFPLLQVILFFLLLYSSSHQYIWFYWVPLLISQNIFLGIVSSIFTVIAFYPHDSMPVTWTMLCQLLKASTMFWFIGSWYFCEWLLISQQRTNQPLLMSILHCVPYNEDDSIISTNNAMISEHQFHLYSSYP